MILSDKAAKWKRSNALAHVRVARGILTLGCDSGSFCEVE